jgi:AraC-like DNA-binding protein
MGNIPPNALDVRVRWANHHKWPAGYSQDSPCSVHALWLVIEGEAEIISGEDNWTLAKGQVLLWPKDKPRHVATPKGASWLSLGISVTTTTQTDLFRLLTLPALQRLDTVEMALLQRWMQSILDLRHQLTQTTPENRQMAKYFADSPEILAMVASYSKWINQLVLERPSHYDEMEAGLVRTIVAWCWSKWGNIDLASALHQQSPLWLQNTLDRIQQSPDVLVSDLAKVAGFSPAQFRRTFHQRMGQSPSDYLQSQRLEKARVLLEDTDLNIGEIAARTGFASVPHFVRLWKARTGLPPLQYRISLKNVNI